MDLKVAMQRICHRRYEGVCSELKKRVRVQRASVFKVGVMDVVLACVGVRVCLRMNKCKLKNGGGGMGDQRAAGLNVCFVE